jgi:hypothetical protein
MAVDYAMLEDKYRLPPGLLKAVRQVESGGDPNAVSQKGARGAFQFMPSTAKAYGIDPTDENQAAEGAAKFFADLNKQYKGDVPKMLAGYNWGSGNIAKHGLEKMPAETRNYITKVQSAMQPVEPAGGAVTFDDLPDDPNAAPMPSAVEAVTFDDLPDAAPAAPAAPQVPQQPELGTAARRGLLGAEALAKGGISVVTGLPDIGASIPILANNLISKDRKWNQDLFPITNKAFELAGRARDALGIPNAEPKTTGEKFASAATEFATGAVGGGGLLRGLAKAAPEVAPLVARLAPELGAKLANPVENFPRLFNDVAIQQAANARAAEMTGSVAPTLEKLKPTLAQAVSGAGAGVGATAGQEYAPESLQPYASILGALIGAHTAPGIAKFAVSPVSSTRDLIRNSKLETQFGDGSAFSLPPNTKTVDRAAKIYQDYAGDTTAKQQALQNIDEGLQLFPDGSVKPTTGVLSDNAGLIQLEKGMRISKDPRLASQFINRDRDLAQQNVKDFQKLAPEESGNRQATADTILGQVDEVRAQEAAKVRSAEQKLADEQKAADELLNNAKNVQQERSAQKANAVDQAQQAADQQRAVNKDLAQEISVTPRLDRETAGKALVEDVLTPAKQAKVDQYRQMISPFEKDTRPSIDTSSIAGDIEPLERYKKVFGESSSYKGLIDQVIGSTKEAKIAPSELLATEQDINRAMRQAKSANDGNALAALGHAKGLVGRLLDEAVPPEMADKYKEARSFYKENVAEPFTQGTTGEVLAAGKKGEAYNNSIAESIPAYFQKGAKAGASMDQLIQAGGKENVLPLVRDYIVDDLFKQHYNPQTNEFNTKAMRKYISDRPEAFDRVPEIRTELHQMLNKLDAGQNLSDIADNAVTTAKQDARAANIAGNKYVAQRTQKLNESVNLMKQKLAETSRQADETVRNEERSAAKFYLDNSEPQVAVEKALNDRGNLTKNLSELVQRTKRDSSGKAFLGLQEAIFHELEKKISSGNEALARGDAALDLRKTKKVLDEYSDALVKSGVYDAEAMKVIDTIGKRMGIAQRGNLRVTAGSDTVEKGVLSETQKVIARSSLRAIYGGLKGGNQFGILRDALDFITGADRKARAVAAVAQRAMMDPELGKLLLKRDLSRYEESVYRTKINRILSTRNALAVSESDN